MVSVNDIYKVKIIKQDNFGVGIAKINDILVFVNNALPNEVVDIKIIEVKKTYARAIIKSFDQKVDREVPKCLYYDECGGCQLMHQCYKNQLQYKENKVRELFNRNFRMNIVIKPILAGNNLNYRNKITFRGNSKGLGLYKEKTHDVCFVDECLLVSSDINDIYQAINNYVKRNDSEIINELIIRESNSKEIMLIINGTIDIKNLLGRLNNFNIISIYYNDKLVSGHASIVETIGTLKFNIYPKAFFQVNYKMMLILYKIIADYYKKHNYSKVLDLYCGTGTIGLKIAPYVDEVVGIEVNADSIKGANENKILNNVNNINFILGKVEDSILSFSKVDSIIVDPPRSGLDNKTIITILKILPTSIIYVSCNPITLIRDLKILIENYNIIEVIPIDMFPNTYHVECVSVLHRKSLEK